MLAPRMVLENTSRGRRAEDFGHRDITRETAASPPTHIPAIAIRPPVALSQRNGIGCPGSHKLSRASSPSAR